MIKEATMRKRRKGGGEKMKRERAAAQKAPGDLTAARAEGAGAASP